MKKSKLYKDLSNVFYLIGKNKKRFLTFLILFGAADAALDMSFSFAIKMMIDHFVDSVQGSIRNAIIAVVIILISGGVLLPIFIFHTNRNNAKILNDVRTNLFKQLQDMPVNYFESHHSGDTLSRVNKDINALESGLRIIERFVILIVRMMLTLPYIMILDYRLGLAALGIGVLAMFFNLKFRLPMRTKSKAIHKRTAELTEQMTENVTGFNVIKTYNLSDLFLNRYITRMDDVMKSQLGITTTNAWLYSSNALIGWFGRGGLGLLGCYWVIKGSMAAGTLMGSLHIAGNISFILVAIGEMSAEIQKSFAGSDRIYEILNEKREPERYLTEGFETGCGIAMKDAVFSYDDDSNAVNGLEFCVDTGSMAALVGYSGGGKSTVIKLLMGLYKMQSGEITIDGHGMNEYSLEDLRSKIAYVPQDAYVFNGSISENIRYGRPEATDAEVRDAAIKANAHGFIMEQKDTYETLVGERGIRLSGGQRQRVAIARAILKDAPVLLLDEATSSLDSESEYLVQNALNELMKNRTSLVVAHRLSTIEKADVIFFISEGKVIEKGTHEQLLKLNNAYAELYYREFAS